MTHREADRLAKQLARACPDLVVGASETRGPGWGYQLTVYNTRTETTITLPDALSVQSYLDARRGYRAEAGAPDFGPGKL